MAAEMVVNSSVKKGCYADSETYVPAFRGLETRGGWFAITDNAKGFKELPSELAQD
jgi:hypothetical protein